MSARGEDTLTPSERSDLLVLARAALEDALARNGALERALAAVTITTALREERAAFVSLHTRRDDGGAADPGGPKGGAPATGTLRGCIGTLDARESLYRSVIGRAVDAALRDPRFPHVTAVELPHVAIEISALTPLRPVAGPDEIVCGRDGVELERGTQRAVFLPQVATEQGWDVGELLRQLARKAGLRSDEWAGARLSVFRAEVFGEDGGRLQL